MRSDDRGGGLGTIASAALGLGLGLGILVLGVIVSQISLSGGAVAVTATKTPQPTPSASGTPLPTLPPPTKPPTPAPTATSTPVPLIVSAYEGQGLQLAALSAPVGFLYRSPITGSIHIEYYQYIDGQIRQDAGGPGILSYPYIYIRAPEQEVKMRPGAVDQDVKLLVREGQFVTPGDALFETVGGGPSSWHTFYDDFVTAQVIVSVRRLPSGEGIDPVPLFQK